LREQLEKRIKGLQAEFESGQRMLSEMDAKQAKLRESMLRISGAIQVLQEELNKATKPVPDNEKQPVESTESDEKSI